MPFNNDDKELIEIYNSLTTDNLLLGTIAWPTCSFRDEMIDDINADSPTRYQNGTLILRHEVRNRRNRISRVGGVIEIQTQIMDPIIPGTTDTFSPYEDTLLPLDIWTSV